MFLDPRILEDIRSIDPLAMVDALLILATVGFARSQSVKLDELRTKQRAHEIESGNKLATLEQITGFDALTGLRGQRWFENALATALRGYRPVSIIYIDLDGIKTLNSTKGHQFVDGVIRNAAMAIRTSLRRTADRDMICRRGTAADEFLVRSVSRKQRRSWGPGTRTRKEEERSVLDNLIFKQVQLLSSWRKSEARSPSGRLTLKRVKRERKADTPRILRGTRRRARWSMDRKTNPRRSRRHVVHEPTGIIGSVQNGHRETERGSSRRTGLPRNRARLRLQSTSADSGILHSMANEDQERSNL